MDTELANAVKNGLKLFADLMLTIQQAKDGRPYGAGGYAARTASDLVATAQSVSKLASNANRAPARQLNLTGHWRMNDGTTADVFDFYCGFFLRVVGNKRPTVLYKGGALVSGGSANILLSGINSQNDEVIIKCEANDTRMLGTFWFPTHPEWAPKIIQFDRLDRTQPT